MAHELLYTLLPRVFGVCRILEMVSHWNMLNIKLNLSKICEKSSRVGDTWSELSVLLTLRGLVTDS